MIDRSISFGQQNFLFVQSSEVDEVYDYASYMTKKGSILLVRYPKDEIAETLYWLGHGVYVTIWTAREDKTYVLPNQLIDQDI